MVIPALETQQYRLEMPYDKELRKFVDNGQVQIFRFVHCRNNSLTTHILSIGHVALLWNSQDYAVSNLNIRFCLKFLGVPVQNHIVRMPNSVFNFTECLVHRSVIKREKLELPVNYRIKIYSGTGCSKVLLYMIFLWQYSFAVCSIEHFINIGWMLYHVCLWQFKLEIYPAV